MEAIKQQTGKVPLALCRVQVAQLFPRHRAFAVPAHPQHSEESRSEPNHLTSTAHTRPASNFVLPQHSPRKAPKNINNLHVTGAETHAAPALTR